MSWLCIWWHQPIVVNIALHLALVVVCPFCFHHRISRYTLVHRVLYVIVVCFLVQ